MLIKFFTKCDCPRCPAAKKLISDLRIANRDLRIEEFDVNTVDGLAEAAFYSVMSTPSIIICDDDGKEAAGWRGETPTVKNLELKIKNLVKN